MKFLASAFFGAALLAAIVAAVPAHAQTYPSRPIRLIVPSAAGGGYDTVGRLVAEKLSAELGQSVMVENRTGAGSVVGTQLVANAAPDGYTLVMGGMANMAFNPGLYSKLPYDPATDFRPVALVGVFSYTLVARKDLAQSSLNEVVAFARANPGKLAVATAGPGSGQHIAAAMLMKQAGIDLVVVPYKGAQPAYSDLFGGRIDLFFDATSTVRPLVDSDRVKALAISSSKREPMLPTVPTAQEAGVPALVLETWIGVFAPAKTPDAAIERLRMAMEKVVRNPDVSQRLEASGTRPMVMSGAETDRFIKAELEKWPPEIRRLGIKMD
ncbi:tripartite tricarboxylate transporter substrate binding protein [Ramlibacter sp. AW1]|uniref:Tripartite tricarboxylate transporter substrate binding protein n=1 Tax=Ramlibacter aurantiacus TaxID=2801330 RepID=A0A937D722_9BURK|nr:tripartite tricarboxylate transporter substrate binding protein [Ramlibacter aurantiacus]